MHPKRGASSARIGKKTTLIPVQAKAKRFKRPKVIKNYFFINKKKILTC